MTSALETVAAWPVGTAADKALQRTAITKRFIWVFADTEDTQNFDVVDLADGTLPLYIQWKGILFQYDSTDTTTAHDGTTCAVTADAKRYKAVAAIPAPYAVLSTSTTAQPASPVVGDTYYIPTAATGAVWSGKDGQIGVYLARGWVFQSVRIGQFVYDESTDTYYHKTAAGTLTAGFGAQALGSGQVLPSNMSGGGGKVRWFIENQTTNAPPGSPTANVEYIIGSSPTGAWAGKATQIARYESGAWSYYVPGNGWKAYDKSLNQDITFNGTAWVSSVGAWIFFQSKRDTADYSTQSGDSGNYVYSGTPPISAGGCIAEPHGITRIAARSGATLRLRYECRFFANVTDVFTVALFKDTDTNAVVWHPLPITANFYTYFSGTFEITTVDTLSHDYSIHIMRAQGSNFIISDRYFSIEEAA